jgi:hypothetical protein
MKINKSMEIAQFSLKQGVLLSAREMWERGFRYSRGETTPDNIGVVLNKIHESDRFVVERTVSREKAARRCRVLVTEIKKPETLNRARNDMLPQLAERWRWLLSRRVSV